MFEQNIIIPWGHPLVKTVCFRITLPMPKDSGAKYEVVDENIADILSVSDDFKVKTKHSGNIVEFYIEHRISSDKGCIWSCIDGIMNNTDVSSSELTEGFLSQIHSAFEKYYSKKFSLSTEESEKAACLTFTEIN